MRRAVKTYKKMISTKDTMWVLNLEGSSEGSQQYMIKRLSETRELKTRNSHHTNFIIVP